jgi:LrgB-like family
LSWLLGRLFEHFFFNDFSNFLVGRFDDRCGRLDTNMFRSKADAFGIKDAVARGLGIGAAAHGLGTAAFANEEDAFPFAAIAMALTASACTVLVSIPVVKKMILQLALGW